jgi:uncharacterized protein YkwD
LHAAAAAFVAAAATGGPLTACGSDDGSGDLGSSARGAVACESSDDCGGSSECLCGVCTSACTTADDCAAFDDPHCAPATDPSVTSQCPRGEARFGLCLPSCNPGGCDGDQSCIAGSCTALLYPATTFCQPGAAVSPGDRAREDALLAAIQTMRAMGGIICGGFAPTTPAPALRVDAALTCAARIFAADLVQSGAAALDDSLGRDTRDRIALAGYEPTSWGESFSRGPSVASDALAMILERSESCLQLNNPALVEVGVGSVGDVLVATLATPR